MGGMNPRSYAISIRSTPRTSVAQSRIRNRSCLPHYVALDTVLTHKADQWVVRMKDASLRQEHVHHVYGACAVAHQGGMFDSKVLQ